MKAITSGEQRVRDDLAVEFIFDAAQYALEARWIPRPPAKLAPAELNRYREIRDGFLKRIASQVGGSVLVVEP